MGQKLGQHFLRNKDVLSESARIACSVSTPIIIEIGPGHGELTKEIKNETSKTKNALKIIAIEKDEALAKKLTDKFREDEDVQIIHGDALKELESVTSSFSKPYVIAGNIPYYITGHLLRKISELKRKPELSVLIIQKEVAERLISQPPKMNLLAASTQIWATPKIIRIIPKTDFSPPPKVDSAFITLESRFKKIPEHYYEVVKILFSHPRKTVSNNLSDAIPKKFADSVLELCKIEKNSRPQNLSLETITAIVKIMYNKHV